MDKAGEEVQLQGRRIGHAWPDEATQRAEAAGSLASPHAPMRSEPPVQYNQAGVRGLSAEACSGRAQPSVSLEPQPFANEHASSAVPHAQPATHGSPRASDKGQPFADAALLAAVTTPVFFIVGDRDRMCPPEVRRAVLCCGGPPGRAPRGLMRMHACMHGWLRRQRTPGHACSCQGQGHPLRVGPLLTWRPGPPVLPRVCIHMLPSARIWRGAGLPAHVGAVWQP